MTDSIDETVPTMPLSPESAAVAAEPVAAPYSAPAVPVASTASADYVSFPRRWLVVGGSVAVAFVLLSGTFAAGVAVGHRTAGFGGRGEFGRARMMQGQPGFGYGERGMMGRGWQGEDGQGYGYDRQGQNGQGFRGGMMGRGFGGRGWNDSQQDGSGSLSVPQNQSQPTTPNQ